LNAGEGQLDEASDVLFLINTAAVGLAA